MISLIRTHPVRFGAGAVAVLAGLAWVAFGYFGVHLLFVDDVVDEAAPVFDTEIVDAAALPPVVPDEAAVAPAPVEPDRSGEPTGEADQPAEEAADQPAGHSAEEPPAPPDPVAPTTPAPEITVELTGTFVGNAHPTAGRAVVLGNGTGQRFLRFEEFETDNGPDLNVYLVDSSTGDVSDHVDLGDLKGNIGDQNYEIPADVDLEVYDQVVIWCVRFGVGFGRADLIPVT